MRRVDNSNGVETRKEEKMKKRKFVKLAKRYGLNKKQQKAAWALFKYGGTDLPNTDLPNDRLVYFINNL